MFDIGCMQLLKNSDAQSLWLEDDLLCRNQDCGILTEYRVCICSRALSSQIELDSATELEQGEPEISGNTKVRSSG